MRSKNSVRLFNWGDSCEDKGKTKLIQPINFFIVLLLISQFFCCNRPVYRFIYHMVSGCNIKLLSGPVPVKWSWDAV